MGERKDFHASAHKSNGINFMKNASQIYRLCGFIPNLCVICYFIGSYCLNMNVVHYLNTEVVATPLWAKCEDETHTPKSENLESSGTPATLKLDNIGQNTLP